MVAIKAKIRSRLRSVIGQWCGRRRRRRRRPDGLGYISCNGERRLAFHCFRVFAMKVGNKRSGR